MSPPRRRLLLGLGIMLLLVLGGLWLLGREVARSSRGGAEAIAILLTQSLRQVERVDTVNTKVPHGSRIQLGAEVIGKVSAVIHVAQDTGRTGDTAWVSARQIGPLAALMNAQPSVVYVGAVTTPEMSRQLQNSDVWLGHVDSLADGALVVRLERGARAALGRAPAQLYLPQDTLSIPVF